MRIAALADIHSNLPALEAVFEAMPPVDTVLCVGDIVGYYPWPAEALEQIRDRNIPCVQGNHDRAVAQESSFRFNSMAKAGVDLALNQLSDEQRDWLAGLPQYRHVHDGRIAMVHGHPADPDRYTYPDAFHSDLLGEEELLLLGHTHIQHAAVVEGGIIVNPGSVGQPRDGDPRASFSVIDLESHTVDERRVDYNIERVIREVSAKGLPEELGTRLRMGQ